MSKNIGRLCLLLVASVLFASCLDTDYTDNITLYDDIAITQFNITNAKLTKHTTSSTGEDSVYVEDDQSVADYPFYIDQLNGEIYNVDSLPVGVDATRLLCSAYTKNNASVLIENRTRDSLRTLSSTDSIDFSYTRYLRAYASDGRSYRQYRVRVNVHREEAGQFRWTRLPDNADFAAMEGVKMVAFGGRVLLFGLSGGTTSLYSTADGSTWTRAAQAFGGDVYNNVAVKGDTLFVLDGSSLLASVDGESFYPVGSAAAPQRLVGASTSELYGLEGGLIVRSADGGRTWSADALGDDPVQMPATDIASVTVPYDYVDSTDYVLLVGNRSVAEHQADTTARVWRKIVEYAAGSESSRWVYMEADSRNYYPLPRLSGLNVLDYDGRKIAFGGAGIGDCTESPYASMYESRDGGLTWQRSTTYTFPDGFDSAAVAVGATADGSGNIWVVCAGSGEVWRGRLNSIDWDD